MHSDSQLVPICPSALDAGLLSKGGVLFVERAGWQVHTSRFLIWTLSHGACGALLFTCMC